MKNTQEKRPIAPILRKMHVGDVEIYPPVQYSSLRSTAHELKVKTGAKYTRKLVENKVLVTRVE